MESVALPVLVPSADTPAGVKLPCTQCAHCCTYVTVGISAPTTAKLASDILWLLYHEKVSIYRSGQGDWFVQFNTPCRNLTGGCLCGIYAHRPHMCRQYKDTRCELNSKETGRYFRTPKEFSDYLQHAKKKIYRALEHKHLPPNLKADA